MSGFCTAAASAALPDTGLLSYAEMLAVGRAVHEATTHIPIIGDGDTGYGNAVNVKRTVKGYASAGFAGSASQNKNASSAQSINPTSTNQYILTECVCFVNFTHAGFSAAN
jgi:hypothetical protein